MVVHRRREGVCLHFLYTAMVLTAAVVGTYAAVSPFWLRGSGNDLGVTMACRNGTCERYGNSAADIPVYEWRGTAGLLIAAMAVNWLVFILAVLTSCVWRSVMMYLQIPLLLVTAIAVIVALFLFGAGLDSHLVKATCNPGADNFNNGSCELGSGLALAFTSMCLLIVSSFTSCCIRPSEDYVA
eukprot:m.151425 g.151425  ORF g.151425 m.151425 type:complete len:184 (-) comp16199_c5_seq1:68-619(-)